MQPMTVFYVQNPINSAMFYAELLNAQILEQQTTFCLLLVNGVKLAFWQANQVQPVVNFEGANSEFALKVDNTNQVDELFKAWQSQFIVLQTPTQVFGYTFTLQDCDGIRVRVYSI
ncbi:VOC family protein [Acinetobacter sp. HY1485]|uniref:VOC family protein n=1 Tax=Acinetobacter sp. HY1485 TaxID=2970918 RepID=UPI0022B9AE06|nr:VOC family protein [Acinetobacter sp. HY1485]